MKTPKEYVQNLKVGIITDEMLSECLYSVNKRAKNCRDRERYYRSFRYDAYNNVGLYYKKKQHYYSQKDIMLSILQPDCIHKETIQTKERIYSYEPEYYEYEYSGQYFHTGGYWDNEEKDYVEFIDVYVPIEQYYLFYNLGTHTFHSPIDYKEIKKYPSLQIVDISTLYTFGQDTHDLISTQFVNKVIDVIQSGNFKIQLMSKQIA